MAGLPNPVGPEARSSRSVGVRTSFVKETYTSQNPSGFGLTEYGYVPDGDPVPDEYLARITSVRNQATVVAPLQESIALHVESFWGPAVPATINDLANKIFQAVSVGRMSAVTKATSRRIWMGSRPIAITMRLRFEAVEDAVREVVEPVRLLQSLALPSEPKTGDSQEGEEGFLGGVRQVVPFLAPPGPTPFSAEGLLNLRGLTQKYDSVVQYLEGLKGGDKIMVEIGRFLTFPNVVLVAATPVIPIAFTPQGDPIRAEVSVTFETYEMMTVEALGEVFKKTTASNLEGEEVE